MSTHLESSLLSETLFPRNRRAVLSLLYGNPDQEFYLRQVVRLTGGGHGAIQRELAILAKAGIVRRTLRANLVYFQADPQCPVFEELKAILVKTAGAVDILKPALAPLASRIQIAFIFGSVARAQQTSQSDLDVLLVGDVGFREVVAALADAQSQLGREVNPTVYTVAEFRSKLASGHHFLKNVLKKPKVFLIGDDRELVMR